MADLKKDKGVTVRLVAADGSQLKVVAKTHKASGQVTSFIQHTTAKNGEGKRTHSKGASQTHETLAKAQATVDELVRVAKTRGWVQPVSNGFVAKPDAFDAQHIPMATTPPKAPTTPGKK